MAQPATGTIAQQQAMAEQVLQGGVGASARFNPVLGHALYVARGEGARIWDIEGREYIDFNLSHGATFLGHGHPGTRAAIERALDIGAVCAYETPYHTELARQITEVVPCAERVRFVNTGSEATMIALRIARAATGRSKYLKFWGHFHGLSDGTVYNAHSPDAIGPGQVYLPPLRESAGVPPALDQEVIVIPWQDEDALARALAEHGHEIAAVIMEPVNFNQGCLIPENAYLQAARRLTEQHGCLLIFDEVLSGFRFALGGAQEWFGVTPDLCCLAKAIANGVPLGVVAGRAAYMAQLSPGGKVSQSGTYAGHLFGVMAGLATLEVLRRPGFYDEIHARARQLYDGLNSLFRRYGLPAVARGLGARFGLYFGFTEPPRHYAETFRMDSKLAAAFLRACAAHGVYFHNYGTMVSGHHGFSAAHSAAIIDEALGRIEAALKDIMRR